jgi:hypothetical protein
MAIAPRKTYETPGNLVELLDRVVAAASDTAFYGAKLDGQRGIDGMNDFRSIPITPIAEFRRQRLADTVARPTEVEWIVGPRRGRVQGTLAVAEGVDQTGARYDVFRDALREADPDSKLRSCAVISSPERRYFAAEISTILGYVGIQAHVFADKDRRRTREILRVLSPEIVVVLSDWLAGPDIPSETRVCVTFDRGPRLMQDGQIDMYHIDELGFLGHSTDGRQWILYNDLYLYEKTESGRLVVTALHNLVQPLLRIETEDPAEAFGAALSECADNRSG